MPCALLVTRVGEALELLPRLSPALCGEMDLTGQIGRTCVFVEQAPMRIGLEQRLVFMLAMNINEQFAQRLQVALRAG